MAAIPLRWLGLSASAAALAVSGLFGGLQSPDQPETPVVRVGAIDRGTPWNVTVLRARLVKDLSPLKPQQAGDHWLAVVAKVEITADESRNDLSRILRVAGAEGLTTEEPAYVMLLRDATQLPHLQPGLPEDVAFVWERSGTATPAKVTVQIYGLTYRLDVLGNRMEWLDPTHRADVVAPVQDRRAG